MSERVIDEVKIGIYNNRLSSLRFSVRGGSTGEHFVQFLQGDWRCDCKAFMSLKECRHLKSGKILLNKIQEALIVIEEMEYKNWK